MPELKIKCDICDEIIATADTEDLFQPITGAMFKSPDSFHGMDAPFHLSLTWETMRCPICRIRPFMVDYEIMTTDGAYQIPEKKQEIIEPDAIEEPKGDPKPWEIAEIERKKRIEDSNRVRHGKRGR
jgi:hypothetical protein